MGIEILLYLPLIFLLTYLSTVNWMNTYARFGPPPPFMYLDFPSVLVALVVSLVGLLLNVMFGYFNMQIGSYYGVPTVGRAGKDGIVLSILLLVIFPLELGRFGLFPFQILSLPDSAILALLISLSIAIVIVTLEFIIMMYRGLGGMKKETFIEGFGTAKLMWILGFITYLTMPIAMIAYGNALRKLSREEQETVPEQATKPKLGAETNYCSRCGSKIEPGTRFCDRCGSPI